MPVPARNQSAMLAVRMKTRQLCTLDGRAAFEHQADQSRKTALLVTHSFY